MFLLNIVSLLAVSQTIKVIDEVNLQPISNVYIYNGEESVLTNTDGKADLSNFNDSLTIFFQHSSYKTFTLLKSNIDTDNFKIRLTESVLNINEVVVSASRWEQEKEEVPNKIISISGKDILFVNPQTSADMLTATNEVFVQKSQMGGGSPMIRGFAANSVLLVVDGVRMNNAIFRSGNLQNVISLDANSIENAEVIFGPGSVIYGSDALGGVMDFHTLQPKLSTTNKIKLTGSAMFRRYTANDEKTGHFDISIGAKKWSSLTSATFSSFGDIIMGSVGNPVYVRPEYVEIINGKDSIVKNNDVNKQVHTGYNQYNLMQKIRFRPNEKIDIVYGFHYSYLSDVPRYDRLIQYKNNKLKYAEWYYGPQKWMMSTLSAKYTDTTKLFDEVKLVVAYQKYEESRHDRKFDKKDIRERTENVDAYSVNLDFDKLLTKKLTLFYGAEAIYNKVNSIGQKRNVNSGELVPYASRYPDGSKYFTFAGYLSVKYKLNDKTTFNIGGRYSRIILSSNFDTTFYKFPFKDINISTGALNGSVGLTYRPTNKWQFNINTSSGFRAPNVDDVGKVFDSEPGNVVVPNENLSPEYAYNIDLGIVKNFNDNVKIDVTTFYTYLKDAMVRRDFTFNGKDSIMYDGEMSKVQALVNDDYATIYGVQFGFYADVFSFLSLKSNLSYTKGIDSKGLPVRHVAPLFGSTHLIFKFKQFKFDIYSNYNGEISNSNLAPSEQAKIYMYATDVNGKPYSPAWATINVKASYNVMQFMQLYVGAINISDVRYRPYSSGVVSAGKSGVFGVRMYF